MDYKSHIKEFHDIDDSPYGKQEEIYLPDGREFIVDRWDMVGNDIQYHNVYNLNDFQDENGNRKLNPVPIQVDQELDAKIIDYISKTHRLAIGDDDEFDPNYASKSSVAPFATRPPRGNLNEIKHINLKRLIEQFGNEGQYYNLNQDFSGFNNSMESSIEQLKQKFQTTIGEKLNGKRVMAKASRGYKQYVKDYEFDVSKVTIDDYYDNYVVVAHDMHTAKPKEYFLDPKSQIRIIGPATGQPSPQKGVNPARVAGKEQPHQQPITHPPVATAPIKEAGKDEDKQYAAYPIDSIVEDIATWVPSLLKKPKTQLLDFVKKIGWTDTKESGVIVSVFEIHIPTSDLKYKLEQQSLENFILNRAKSSLKIIDLELDKAKGEYIIKIKKIYRK